MREKNEGRGERGVLPLTPTSPFWEKGNDMEELLKESYVSAVPKHRVCLDAGAASSCRFASKASRPPNVAPTPPQNFWIIFWPNLLQLLTRTVEDAGPYKILTNKSGYSEAMFRLRETVEFVLMAKRHHFGQAQNRQTRGIVRYPNGPSRTPVPTRYLQTKVATAKQPY